MTHTLHIDFETRSTVDLRRAGVYRYAEDPMTDVWCAAYAVDDGPVKLWTPGDAVPAAVDQLTLLRNKWEVVAHNANFERAIWQHILLPRYGWFPPKLTQWRCTMAQALAMSLPASLENAAAAAGLDTGKDMGGRRLMLQMAQPRRPRKSEDPNALLWWDDEERKQRLYAYCKQDVEVERKLDKKLLKLTDTEQKLWRLDQVINDRGVFVDVKLCEAALKVVNEATRWLNDELREITDGAVSAATNVGQLHAWLRTKHNMQLASLDKEAIEAQLIRKDLPAPVRRALEIRRDCAKTSVKKIDALLAGRSKDGRARGLLQYHAASTGRWAGRRFQPQNIKRPELENVDQAIDLVATGSASIVDATYDLSPLAVVGDCLRGMVRAPSGRKIVAGDYANIEGRILAWLAGEEWKLDAFERYDEGKGPDLYKLAYARSFGVKPDDVDKERRQVGKVMELALGYQGGVGAFQTMASNYGVEVSDDRAEELKVAWREAHPKTEAFWYTLEKAAMNAVRNQGRTSYVNHVAFRRVGAFLYLRLPSGRTLCYPYPAIVPKATPWGEMRDAVKYKGVNSYTRQWDDCYAYGGLWAENVTQAVARDILAEGMIRLEKAGYPIILTVHDEIVCEVPSAFGSVSAFETIICEIPEWADGLPIAAEAWEGERYRK